MPKYKYVDGVKYRVVPQSVLGYALVREDSDNSLPAGGTEGQVLAKASNTDYDVEWSTVESGGDDLRFVIDTVPGISPNTLVLVDETKAGEYFNNLKSGKIPILCIDFTDTDTDATNKLYASDCSQIESEIEESEEVYIVTFRMTTVRNSSGVSQRIVTVSIGKTLPVGSYSYVITVDDKVYPGVG